MKRTLDEWLLHLERQHPQSIDLGLERCGAVYRQMGTPLPGRTVVTVAGTNGKGSAVAWLESLLDADGSRTAAYTSPHLLSFNERLRLDRRECPDVAWVEAFERVEAARKGVSLTYFEFTTLAAFHLMAAHRPDVAILEVGLGGRLDTVNLVDADVVLMMPIGLDHQAWLGRDREAIGREKAGVMRAGQAVFCAESSPPASLVEHARSLGARLYLPGTDFHAVPQGSGLRFTMGCSEVHLPRLPLEGAHQVQNLGPALAAYAWLRPDAWADPQHLAAGVGTACLPGRLMVPEGFPELLVDVGHNPMAARVVATYLAGRSPAKCVLGMLADKDVEAVARVLAAVVDRWYCAGLPGERGQSSGALAERLAQALPGADVADCGRVPDALRKAMAERAPEQLILVFGSFETASRALREIAWRAGGAEKDTIHSRPVG